VDHFESHVLGVFANALEYYDEGSDMYECADMLRQVFKELRARVEGESTFVWASMRYYWRWSCCRSSCNAIPHI
jgi:hypothetical protein